MALAQLRALVGVFAYEVLAVLSQRWRWRACVVAGCVGLAAAPAASASGLLSADGSHVVFATKDRLVKDDRDGQAVDIYDRSSGHTSLISTGLLMSTSSATPVLNTTSADGSTVIFSTAAQLTEDDLDDELDVYERTNGVTTLLSVGPLGGNGPGQARFEGASADATRVFFRTHESLVPEDTDGRFDVYQRAGGVTTLVSTGPTGGNAQFDAGLGIGLENQKHVVSDDGQHAFFSTVESLTPDDTDHSLDIYERAGGSTRLVSIGSAGGNGPYSAIFRGASADGSHAYFTTDESLVAADGDTSTDLYDSSAAATVLVTPDTPDGAVRLLNFDAASADGSRVIFDTDARLVPEDTGPNPDVYERSGGTTILVSRGTTPAGSDVYGTAFADASPDATSIVFTSPRVLAPGASYPTNVYLRRQGETLLVSQPGERYARYAGISSDGSHVITAVGDFGQSENRGLFDYSGGSLNKLAPPAPFDFGRTNFAGLSDDGSLVAFTTTNPLSPLDRDEHADVYVAHAGEYVFASQPPPDTQITSGPSGPTAQVTPRFKFAADRADVSFTCAVDNGAYAPCSSPWRVPAQPSGDHVVRVQATDSGDNLELSPARRYFTVVP
jgi:hypothetical protein